MYFPATHEGITHKINPWPCREQFAIKESVKPLSIRMAQLTNSAKPDAMLLYSSRLAKYM